MAKIGGAAAPPGRPAVRSVGSMPSGDLARPILDADVVGPSRAEAGRVTGAAARRAGSREMLYA
jgi:hypothetical protein